MRQRPNDRLQAIVAVALGEIDERELGDLTRAESVRLLGLRRVAKTLKERSYVASEGLKVELRSIYASPSPVPMRLVGTSLGAEGVRGLGSESIHASYSAAGEEVRIVYLRQLDGWRVSGQGPGPGWNVVCEDVIDVTGADGRFDVVVSCDALPEVTLISSDRVLVVPPPTERQ